MEAPERIYLQASMTEEDDDWDDEVGVTWCVDRINDTDVEYVRRDVAAKLRAALAHYRLTVSAYHGKCADLFAETAWLADSPEAAVSLNAENGEESEGHVLADGKLHDGISTTGQWGEGEA